mgnify:CR=1 FL=1
MKGLVRIVLVLIAIGLISSSGIYMLQDGEKAVITRFGAYLKTEETGGLKWKVPFIDQRYIVNTEQVRRLEFGFRTISEGDTSRESSSEDITGDSLMITGDENLVHVTASIQYSITSIRDYLFNVDDQESTLNIVSVSAIRRSVANNTLNDVLTDNKSGIMQEIKTDLQKICDNYGMGVRIIEVALQDVNPPAEVDDAFKDITRAQLDKEAKINEASSYQNKVIPEAKGQASKLISEAEAYREDRINRAKGDVANFNQIYAKYVNSKNVTRTRMYLETMAEVLKNAEIYITQEDGNTLKFLPLQNAITGGGQ